MSVRSGFIVLAVVSPFLAACAVFVSNADSCSVDPKDRPVEVMRLPQVQEVPEQEANVIVEVKSSLTTVLERRSVSVTTLPSMSNSRRMLLSVPTDRSTPSRMTLLRDASP